MKKRVLSLLLILVMMLSMFPVTALASGTENVAYVTIAEEGDLKLVRYPVALTDVNENGKLDIDDALYLAHNNADADQYGGYASSVHETYGRGVTKLWGDTSGWYGYTLNGATAGSADAVVKAGDELYAWIYTDKVYPNGNPDQVTFFDKTTASVAAGEAVEVTLKPAAAITNGADVAVYKVKANHRIGGEVETDAAFDAEGKASVTFSEAGTYVITAAKQSTSPKAIVAPYCEVTVSESLASTDVMYTLGTATGKPGDTVTVPVTVQTDYATSINSLVFSVLMGDGLELVGATTGTVSDSWDIFTGAGAIQMMGGGGAAFYMPSGELLNLRIKISDDAQPGTYDLDLGFFRYIQGSTDLSVDSAVTKGSITVEEVEEPEPTATFTVGDATVTAGEEFTVSVNAVSTLPQLLVMSSKFSCEGATLTKVELGADVSGVALDPIDGAYYLQNAMGNLWDMPADGELFKLTFKANEDASGTYPVTMTVNSLASRDANHNWVDLKSKATTVAGTVTVEAAAAATPFTVTVGETAMELVSKGSQSFGEGTSECETYEVTVPSDTTSITVSSENKMFFYTPDGSGLGLGTSKTFDITGDTVYKINVSGVGYYYLSVKFEAAAPEGLSDVLLVAPEGLTTEDGINYYGIETTSSYTFGFTTVPEDIEVTQNWTFKDGGNNRTSGSGKEIRVSIWSPGTATLTLTVEDTNDDSNRITKTYYLHEAQAAAVEYDITVAAAEHGTITVKAGDAEVTKAAEGTEITVTATPADGYELDSLTVTDADGMAVTVTDNTFTMPAKAVTVSATFKATTPEEPEMPFTVTVNGEAMTEFALSEVTDPDYGVKPLYTVTIPEGTTEVTITWKDGNKYTLSYYDANCNYFGFESGMKNSWTVPMDKNGDGAYDMLQIYDSGYGVPYWITFASEEPEEEPVVAPFTVTVGGEEMTEFAMSEVTDPDYGVKPLYTVTIPEGTTEVIITWKDGNKYTLSYYDANCNYFGFESGMKNSWTVPMDKNGDGAYDMLQIYDSGYGVPYWITFTSGAEEPEQPEEPNVVTLGNAEAWPGDLIEISLYTECIENDTNVFGRLFIPTLALPDGWTVVGAVAGEDLAGTVWELLESDRYGWCLNGTAENYYGAYLPNGELMKFQIQVAADAEAGEYTVELASAKMMKDDWGAGFSDFELVDGTVTVSIPEGKTKLTAPVLTAESVFAPETYIEITVPASAQEPAAVIEYAISTDGETWGEWQTGNKFTEVEDGTKYYVRARYTPHNVDFYETSDPSNVIEVTTKAFVKDPVIFTFGDVIGSHGETIYVPITLSHGLDGMQHFGSFRFCIEVNENLTLVGVSDGSDLPDTRSAHYDYPDHRAVSLSYSGNYAEVPEGEVMLLEIKVHEDAVPGTYKIGLDQVIEEVNLRYTVDGSGKYGTWIDYPLNVQVVKGTVTIKEPLTAPVLTDYTATDDTITITAPDAVDGATIQYAISTDGKTYGEWQTDNVFAGLDEETTYYVIARYVVEEGHTNADSYASEPLEVKSVNPTAAYTLAEVTAKAGETVEVAVTLEHAIVKQATSFNLIPTATAGVELTAAKAGKDLPEGWKVMLADGVVTVYTTDAAAIPAGEIVVLTYQVGEETADGDYTVTLTGEFTEDGNAFIAADDSVLRVDGTVAAGKITVKSVLYGDVDGNGVVDMSDLITLRRHLAGWEGYELENLNQEAMDVFADGDINMNDAIALARHLAEWDAYLTLPYVK